MYYYLVELALKMRFSWNGILFNDFEFVLIYFEWDERVLYFIFEYLMP